MMSDHTPQTGAAELTPVELTPLSQPGALMGDLDRPNTAFSGGNDPPIPFDD